MIPEGKPQRYFRMLLWVGVGLVTGWLVAGVVCYRIPKLYTSRAVVAGTEPAGREVPLAPLHAIEIVDSLELPNKWNMPREDAIEALRAVTKIRSSAEGIEIVATHHFKEDARDIAAGVARLFRSMDAEIALAAQPVSLLTLTPDDRKARDDRGALSALMDDQAREAGLDDFKKVAFAAASGNAAARALWEAEEFQARWQLYQNLSRQLAKHMDVSEASPAALLVPAQIPQYPSFPVVDRYMAIGQGVGLLAGFCLTLLNEVRLRKRPPAIAEARDAASKSALPVMAPEESW